MCAIVIKDSKISLLILSLIIELCFTETPSKTFSCKNGEYIESTQYCDGYLQCSDGSDEPEICRSTRKSCEPGKYHCPSTDICVDAEMFSDVYVQKYCPSGKNQTDSKNETTTMLNLISVVEDIFSKNDMSQDSENTKFFCDDTRCLKVHYICNGYCDCFNCSGENSSFPEVGIIPKSDMKLCSSQKKKFSCSDNKRCLNLEYVCDGFCNCFDCSDEGEDCSKIDYKMLGTCPHFYFPTPAGPVCIRELDYTKYAATILSRVYDPNDCSEEHICDQKCTQFKTRAICSCGVGYIKVANGKNGFRCQSVSPAQNALVYSTPSQIKRLNLTTGVTTVIKKLVGCQILTAAHDYMYYTTYSDNTIFRYSFTTKKTAETKLDNSRESPITSMAVDYITENLYFTTNTTLSVCSDSEKRTCMQLKCCNVNYVALAPSYGWMFYTKTYFAQVGRYVMRSNMDGTEETVLIDGKFPSITALAVDESIARLYGMVQKEIFSVSFYGDKSEYGTVVYQGEGRSLTALDSRMFYTLVHDRQIYTWENSENFTKPYEENDKITKYQSTLLKRELKSDFDNNLHLIEGELTLEVQDLHAYDAAQQRNKKAKSPCLGGNRCPGLCMLRSIKSTTILGYNCSCTAVSSTTIPYWCVNSAPRTNLIKPSESNTKKEDVTKEFQIATTKPSIQWRPLNKTVIEKKSYHMRSISDGPTTMPRSSPSIEVEQHHTGLEIVCIIALFVLVLCGGYLLYNKWRQYYYNSTTRNFIGRQYNDNERLHIGQEEL